MKTGAFSIFVLIIDAYVTAGHLVATSTVL